MIIGNISRAAALALLALASVSAPGAEDFDIKITNFDVRATPLAQPEPQFPKQGIPRGQEGWVRMSFVVTAEGRAIDPIVIDSSGGARFEKSALEVVMDWQFASPGTAQFNNSADIRFQYARGRDRATSAFERRYRKIVTDLHFERPRDARKEIDSTIAHGGWNLYESAMLWLMIGRVEGAEGDHAAKLESYHRALALSNRSILDGNDRCNLLSKLFDLEIEHAQYASARQTFRQLRKEPAGGKHTVAARDDAAVIDRLIHGSEPISAKATIYNPCDCDSGKPLWSYVPARRTFSFSGLNGNVERFEVRCEKERFSDSIATDKLWSLPEDSGSCRVFVFGDDGANFDFVEHSDDNPAEEAGSTVVAWVDVLDR